MYAISVLAVSARQVSCRGSRVRNRAQGTYFTTPYTSFGQAHEEIMRAQLFTSCTTTPAIVAPKEAIETTPPLDEIPEIPDEDDIQIPPATSPKSVSPPPPSSFIPSTAPISRPQSTDGDHSRPIRRKKYGRGYVPTRPSSLAPRVLAPIPEYGQLVTVAKKQTGPSRTFTPLPTLNPRGASPRLPRALRGDEENQPNQVDPNGFTGKVRRVRAVSRQFGQSGTVVNQPRY